MQGLENNNWIILDQLRNIYEIYANLTVTTVMSQFVIIAQICNTCPNVL